MDLAKHALDVGIFTRTLDAHRSFWSNDVGLSYERMLKLGEGIHQHRFLVGSSVIKVNHSRNPLCGYGSGIAGISLRRTSVAVPTIMTAPESLKVLLTNAAAGQEDGLAVHFEVSDLAKHNEFWSGVMQMPEGEGCFVCGSTSIHLKSTAVPRQPDSWKVLGWSYLTVQVRDCVHEHLAALSRGAREGEPPRRIGDTAVISFIRDPDGNFIELSQKAELVGRGEVQHAQHNPRR